MKFEKNYACENTKFSKQILYWNHSKVLKAKLIEFLNKYSRINNRISDFSIRVDSTSALLPVSCRCTEGGSYALNTILEA